ncbi:leucine-rich repeat-containing protein 56 isoform X1 [Bos javanicus]|uniref:leucine-rich repeat-containing protein 56 isoform X1 n=1 Tax=Bos javanicus TaxID=9906 RepID=UPI002AA75305|nr:leucine-rich repeat-containing protein 56 isoform X1 [Bos javanicus]XP_061263538.1 leucine-rich repeat-containing protein 56 isoform X1 [Bos javanicus]XP_061263539.1 leucine-rich repeat-containing protein 56 isoform X1 [Bos javanicus]
MDQARDGAHGSRPSTASIQVRELSSQGLHNPQPQSKAPGRSGHGHSEQLVEECLSPARLQALAQVDDLRLVSMLEMCVNTRESSLGSLGLHLPNLSQLKLNGSCLGSLRDLGTSLSHLQVLWLARCGLADLDGISSFPALKELYLSYNNIWDLSPLCLLEQLEVLDLEGNCVEDLGQLRYLQLCPQLATLTLEGNPLCLRPGSGPTHQVPQGYNYKAEVRKLIPQLRVLDELPAAHTGLPASQKLDQDWLLVKEAIKEGCTLDSLLPRPDQTHGSPMWRLSPELCLPETQPWAPRRGPLSLLVPGMPLPEGLLPKGPAPEDGTSNLTHGAGRVLCGNPTKGLRERRHGCQAGVHPEKLPSPRLEELAPRASASEPDPADDHDLLAWAGLQALRELRLRPLPSRCPESWEEGAAGPWGPQRGPEEQEDEAGPKPHRSPPSLAPESSRTSGYNLIPCPPKSFKPDRGRNSWGSTDLQFRGRRLRTLGSLGPGLGQGLAPVTALRAREVTSGPSPQAEGCPGPKPAPDSAARPPASGACRT